MFTSVAIYQQLSPVDDGTFCVLFSYRSSNDFLQVGIYWSIAKLQHGVHQFLIVKFHDFLMTFSGAIDIFSWPLRVKFNDFFRTQKRRRRENFFRYLRKMNVFEELWEIAKKSWLFQVFKVFSWLVFAFHDFFQVLQVFQDYQVFQVSGHHDILPSYSKHSTTKFNKARAHKHHFKCNNWYREL